MKIILIDDESLALKGMARTIKEAVPDSEVHEFDNASDAIEFAAQTSCDAAFVDIQLRDMDGITAAERLKAVNVNISIIFTTGYIEYGKRDFNADAGGYILKPVTPEKIRQKLAALHKTVS